MQVNAEVLQSSIYQFYQSLNAWFTHMTDFQNSDTAFVLESCLKQVKDLILEFSIIGSFFLVYHNWLVNYNVGFFLLGACVDQFIDSQANYQGCRYAAHVLHCHTLAVMHFLNGERVC